MNGVEGTRLVREQFPHIKVLMLTTFSDSELILKHWSKEQVVIY